MPGVRKIAFRKIVYSLTLFACLTSFASDNNDKDGDGVSDDDELDLSRNPNFVELHDWTANYNPLSADWNPASDGNWTVDGADANLSVTQSTNSANTRFLTPYDLLNVEINGTMRVSTHDNDFIGLYVAYQSASDYYHFKWSRSEVIDTVPLDGWNLLNSTNGFVSRVDYNESDSSQGWELSVDHNFSLIHTEGLLEMRVQGKDNFSDYPFLFSLDGNYSAGKFGFWTGSQQDVSFSGITFTQLHPPVLTLIGNSIQTHEAATEYLDANATAFDEEDGNLTSSITTVSDVNVSKTGTYYVVHRVIDSHNIERNATRTVIVEDTTRPEITLIGDASVTGLEAGSSYEDANATWTDSLEGSGTVLGTGEVNLYVPGTYLITYNHSDASGNAAETMTRSVTVVDTTAPVIVLNGDSNLTHEVGEVYEDAGANWTDIVDGTGTISATGEVNASLVGVYLLSYDYTDANGNSAETITRTVNVVDTTPPVLQLVGGAAITHEASTDYQESGVVWRDFVDSNDTNVTLELNGTGEVDFSTPGIYVLAYSFSDSAGNEGNATRTITVVDTTSPEASLLGDSNLTHGVWKEFVDPWVDASDSVDGNLSDRVVRSGEFDVNTPGAYLLSYSVQDEAGNTAEVNRTVNVVNSAPTDLSLSSDSISENMPVGSLVGSFNVVDPDDANRSRQYSIQIIEQEGTDHASFVIEPNGDLRTTRAFDYETSPASLILVSVTDELGGNYQEEMEILVVDDSSPIIETTMEGAVNKDGSVTVGGNLIDAGGEAGLLEWGLLVAPHSFTDESTDGVEEISLPQSSGTLAFSHDFLPGDTWGIVFVRAYAVNGEGKSYGLEESIDHAKQYLGWADASPIEGLSGWWESQWLGTIFHQEESPWAMHLEMGWIYPIASDDGSLWLWQDGAGWMWTSPEIFPFFYSSDSSGWRYFFGNVGGVNVFYDYGQKAWTDLQVGSNP